MMADIWVSAPEIYTATENESKKLVICLLVVNWLFVQINSVCLIKLSNYIWS